MISKLLVKVINKQSRVKRLLEIRELLFTLNNQTVFTNQYKPWCYSGLKKSTATLIRNAKNRL